MVKFTDPTYPINYFIVIEDLIYTLEKRQLNEFLEAVENNDVKQLKLYKFNLSELDEGEEHFRVIFEKINTPYIRMLFHE